MESRIARTVIRRANASTNGITHQHRTTTLPHRGRGLATLIDRRPREEITAAPEITFTTDPNQFTSTTSSSHPPRRPTSRSTPPPPRPRASLLSRIRILPSSPSYFTATPRFTDDLLHLSTLLRRHARLPVTAALDAPRTAWKTLLQYRIETRERVREKGYAAIAALLKRLNLIHPALVPAEVRDTLRRFAREVQPNVVAPRRIPVDGLGRATARGARKSSVAKVMVVRGQGEVMVNGRSLGEYFGRMHDRESAVWALKATGRLGAYNVWVEVEGGGTTGQAEAITLAVARALLAHEPELKPALRKAGCITRDPRRVERKKAGKLKARKMPAWVKR